ncbi:class I SAM-dependent methyltransferase [Candidatus Margulisiibacteriota bacterium]
MPICDYSDTDYKQEFWQDQKREYEDGADKIAVLKLLPEQGVSILELGAGFGRLAEVYQDRFQKITLFDYADNLLEQAKKKHQDTERFSFQQGDINSLPYDALFTDTVLMVRVSHHLEKIEKVLAEAARVLRPKGVFVLEYANKRNFKEIGRFLIGRSKMNPFKHNVSDRNQKGFYNYHPAYIEKLCQKAGFRIEKVLSVSNFRWSFLKQLFGPGVLLWLENLLQTPLGFVRFGPSIYLKLRKE